IHPELQYAHIAASDHRSRFQIWRNGDEFYGVDMGDGVPKWRRIRWKQEIQDLVELGRSWDPDLLPVLQSKGRFSLLEWRTGNLLSQEQLPFADLSSLVLQHQELHALRNGQYLRWKPQAFLWSVAELRPYLYTLAIALAIMGSIWGSIWLMRKRSKHERQAVALKQAEIDAEMQAAAEVQKTLQPVNSTLHDWFWCTGETRAAWEVGGDFYAVESLEDGRAVLLLGDVAGHGLQAGIMVAMARGVIHAWSRQRNRQPRHLLEALNQMVRSVDVTPRPLIASSLVVVDPSSGKLEIYQNGAPFPWLLSDGRATRALEGNTSLPLGSLRHARLVPFTELMHVGERLLLVSDGVCEQLNDEGLSFELAGMSRLVEVAKQIKQPSFVQFLQDLEVYNKQQKRNNLDELPINQSRFNAISKDEISQNILHPLFSMIDRFAVGVEQ
ncbi:MAG: serine/threonine-protein phosphatase, partial [Anaerolineae bacterium]|nr:serine/threonine-protein phosphatase [Anaerolineae bacterium]